MLAHRLLGGGSSSLSISCLSLVSALIAVAHALLWSFYRWRSESPLLVHQEKRGKKKSLACSAAPDLLPDSLPASCGVLTPSGCCSCCQAQSSPWDPTEARASASSPRPPRQGSRQTSRAGECWSAPLLCGGISPLCPLQPCGCALLCGSEASPPLPPAVSAHKGAF